MGYLNIKLLIELAYAILWICIPQTTSNILPESSLCMINFNVDQGFISEVSCKELDSTIYKALRQNEEPKNIAVKLKIPVDVVMSLMKKLQKDKRPAEQIQRPKSEDRVKLIGSPVAKKPSIVLKLKATEDKGDVKDYYSPIPQREELKQNEPFAYVLNGEDDKIRQQEPTTYIMKINDDGTNININESPNYVLKLKGSNEMSKHKAQPTYVLQTRTSDDTAKKEGLQNFIMKLQGALPVKELTADKADKSRQNIGITMKPRNYAGEYRIHKRSF